MLCVVVQMYKCETRGQEKHIFIETILNLIFICFREIGQNNLS